MFIGGRWMSGHNGVSVQEWRSPCGWGLVSNFTVTTSSPTNDTRCLDEIAVVEVSLISLLLE